MIALMYGRAIGITQPDGKVMYSMQARADVSRSLDVLGSTPGDTLTRGTQFWEVKPPQPATFRGAKLYRATDSAALNPNLLTIAPFDATEFDTDDFTNQTTHPNQFKIPAGIEYVEITGQIKFKSFTSSASAGVFIFVNGASPTPVWPGAWATGGVTEPRVQVTTGPFKVTAGQLIELRPLSTDTSVTLGAAETWFAIKAM
jgi:hypothetical protein